MTFLDKLSLELSNLDNAEKFSGVVTIQREGVSLFEGAYGYANRSWKVKNDLDTRFRIASVSKMFTAVAVLKLIEEGNLAFDTSVAEYLALDGTRIPGEATVYHMLTMTSGIADWFDESGDWEEDWSALCQEHPIYLFRAHEDYLPLFIDQPPIAPVGEKHHYNGAGFILLGMIIEKYSGLSYADYIQRHIFEPAGMSRSGFPALDDVSDEVAEGYISNLDANENIVGWKKNIYSTTPAAVADGGATSCAADLIRFSRALRSGSLLSPGMTREMLSPKVVSNDEKFRGYTWMYGYGNYFILDDEDQVVRWGHTGEEDGISCRLYHYPEEDLDVIILGNQSWCAGSLGWSIHDLLMERKEK